MMYVKTLVRLLAAIGTAGVSQGALAADLSLGHSVYEAPQSAAQVASRAGWTGCYLGAKGATHRVIPDMT